MQCPILSICIPTYNRPEYLKECLMSIVLGCKNFKDKEVLEIVITDNSDDDKTLEVVNEIKKIFSNIKYFKNSLNIGGSRNILKALESAAGKYLWLMGDDDIIVSSKARKIVETCRNNVYAGIIVNFAQGDGKNPRIIMLDNCLNLKSDKSFVGKDDLFAGEDFVNFFAINFMSALIFKKEYFDQIKEEAGGGIKTCYFQSYVFLLIAALDRSILRLKDVYVFWRCPIGVRRYELSQKNEDDIFRQYIEYVEFAQKKGFIYDQVYKEESVKLKEVNLFYYKRNGWKKPIKFFLVKCGADGAFGSFLYFLRHFRYLIRK